MNRLKQSIGFEEAMQVFDDSYALVSRTESNTLSVAGRRSAG